MLNSSSVHLRLVATLHAVRALRHELVLLVEDSFQDLHIQFERVVAFDAER